MTQTRHHGWHLFLFGNKELHELYASVSLRSFAFALISLFIPIYLVQLGFSIPQVLFFLGLERLAHTLLIIPAARKAAHWGFKHLILYSVPCQVVYWILLFLLPGAGLWQSTLFFAAPLVSGLYKAFYFTGYHVHFAQASDHSHRGREVSIATVGALLFTVVGPAAGGVLLVLSNFGVLFIVASLILMLSTVPLLFTKDVHQPFRLSFKGLMRAFKIKDAFAFGGFGIEDVAAVSIWPLLLFFGIFTENYVTTGAVTSWSLLFSVVATMIIGKLTDLKTRLTMHVGSMLKAIIWCTRFFAKSPFHVYMSDMGYGLTDTAQFIPFDALSYDKANKTNVIHYIIFRELFINGVAALFLFALMFVSNIAYALPAAALASLLFWFF